MCEPSGIEELTNPAPQETVAAAIQASISLGLQETVAAATQVLTSQALREIAESEARPGRPASPATLGLISRAGRETGGKQFEVWTGITRWSGWSFAA